jgi:hypothetical protein
MCVKLVKNPQFPQDARSTEYKIIVVFRLALSYIICDTYDCTHNGDGPPKDTLILQFLDTRGEASTSSYKVSDFEPKLLCVGNLCP